FSSLDTSTTLTYTLSLHDALPISRLFTGILILLIGILSIDIVMDYLTSTIRGMNIEGTQIILRLLRGFLFLIVILVALDTMLVKDRKSTLLNSSHVKISYAVFCLK